MALDPTIPLGFNPNQQTGPSANNLMAMLRSVQEYKATQQQAQRQNTLRQILSNPESTDKTGAVTSDALRQVMAVDPGAAIQIRGQQIEQANQQTLGAYRKSQVAKSIQESAGEMNGQALEVYQEALKNGTPEPQARDQAQKVFDEGRPMLEQLAGPEMSARMNFKFDPVRSQAGALSYKDYLARQDKERTEDRQERQETERERHDDALEHLALGREGEGGWQVAVGKDKAGNDIQYRYNPRTAQSTMLNGQPFAPGQEPVGAARISTAAQSSNAPADLTEARGSMLATGMPVSQAVPGYGKQAAADRQAAQEAAIKQIMRENPGMSRAAAGEELANRQIDYAAGKKSVGQLTTMLGATRQSVSQLEYNVAQAKADMAKLTSSNISPVINAIARGEEKWTGNPIYSSLFFHMNAVATELARLLSGGQASVAQLHQGAMDEAHKWASVNMTPASFSAPDGVANSIVAEGRRRIQTYQDAISRQRSDVAKSPTAAGVSSSSASDTPFPAKTKADYDNLPKGARYTKPGDPPGSFRVKQ